MAPASTPKAPVKKGKRPYTKRKKYNSLEEQLEARSKQQYESKKRGINRKRAARGESPVKRRIVREEFTPEDWKDRQLEQQRKRYHERKKRHSVGPIQNHPPIAPVVAPPVVAAVDPPLAAAGPRVVDGAEPPLGGGSADTAVGEPSSPSV